MYHEDTIASISTSMSDAGIGIVRLSGSRAVNAAARILQFSPDAQESHTIRFNRVLDEDGAVMDEALVSVMRAPRTYTGEDVCEINVHGTRLLMERVLERLLMQKDDGGRPLVRLAMPGEFTKRAFLNGKMDLTRAEAVQDIIGANNRFAAKNAALQLGGVLEKEVRNLREKILYETAFIEAALDDPDVYEEELAAHRGTLLSVLSDVTEAIARLLDTHAEGLMRKDGIACAIVGAPNAGKSTLLNLLSGEERAIVTDLPGTTRDVIEETVRIEDLVLRVRDTAGIRQPADRAEEIGVARARESARDAALVLLVADAKTLTEESLRETLSALPEAEKEQKMIVLLNKTDLLREEERKAAEEAALRVLQNRDGGAKTGMPAVLFVSLREQTGVDALVKTIRELFFRGALAAKEEYYLTNVRHKEALLLAREALLRVKQGVTENKSEDLYPVDLMEAYTQLGFIIGEALDGDLQEKIFASFCLGK